MRLGTGLGLGVLLCACTTGNTGAGNGQQTNANGPSGVPTAGSGVTPTGTSGTSSSPVGTAGVSGVVPQSGGAGVTATAGTGMPAAGRGAAGTMGQAGGSAGTMAAAGTGGGTSGTGSAAGTGGGGPTEMGCGTTKLLASPDDVSMPGPWPVGVRTAMVSIGVGTIPVEIWYPAPVGSEAGKTKEKYDLGAFLDAPDQAAMVPEAEKVYANCNCYRDLPIDTAYGPYPAVIFIHGTGSFRVASHSTMTQWASRGFVVVAADHPGLELADQLAPSACPGTGLPAGQSRDVDAEIAGLTMKTGDFAFLGDSVDMTRIGMAGHSAGASDAAMYSTKPNVQVDIPLADYGGTPTRAGSLKSTLIISGMSDSIVNYSSDQGAYAGSPDIKRLIGITGGDHIDVTDLCWMKNSMGQTGIQVAVGHNLCMSPGLAFLATLAQCGAIDAMRGVQIVNYASTAALEETLHCKNRDAAFAGMQAKFPEIGDYQHSP